MKVKIIPLDWYCVFGTTGLFTFGSPEEEEIRKNKEGDREYDGPLRYLELCPEEAIATIKTWKLHEKPLKYCVKARYLDKFSKDWEDSYRCFTFQAGRWWQYKEPQVLFSDLHIPISTYEDYLKLVKFPKKLLSKRANKDVEYWRHWKELNEIGRSTYRWRLRDLKNQEQ